MHNTQKGSTYDVDADLYTCSCPVGMGGKLCKHLYLVVSCRQNINHMQTMTKMSKEQMFYIATGQQFQDAEHI